ncbi:hypothetical protein BX666DRAFT_1923992 [Dichotomocladium elegans]|nr:hypothetical protein BX666DRAFT_1923992 [Dichotomocladium elegans]
MATSQVTSTAARTASPVPTSSDKSITTTTVTGSDGAGLMTPTSPPYPPYVATFVDPSHFEHHHAANGLDPNDPTSYAAYVYPMSPQFSVQYYQEYINGYQSYPGSPALHPQSPPINPTSPPFSPPFQPTASGITLSPPTHAFVLPSHPPFPPLHISSPVLTGTASVPGSPPHQYIQPLPGSITSDQRPKRNNNICSSSSSSSSNGNEGHFHSHNVYVRGLPVTTTDESFMELCSVYGTITSSKAIIDQKTGECKGYGFVMYASEEECMRSIEGLNKTGLQASFARVGQESFSSRLRSLQDETSTNIYISNLPLSMTELKLEELFRPYKTVSNRILRDPQSNMSRGVGFARMSDRASAVAIIEKFNGQNIAGSSAPLQVRFADSPAQKKLKSQTARKRILRPRDFQPMSGFSVRPMMPITPETMLGIAPAASGPYAYYHPEHQQ